MNNYQDLRDLERKNLHWALVKRNGEKRWEIASKALVKHPDYGAIVGLKLKNTIISNH